MAKSRVVDKDMGWKGIVKAAATLAIGAYVKVGILGGDDHGGLHQTDPKTGKAAKLTIAEIAVVNEFGTEDGSIPPRPAHRITFDRMHKELSEDAGKLLGRIVFDRTITVEDALNVLGLKLATGIKNTITQSPLPGIGPGNAPITRLVKAMRTGAFDVQKKPTFASSWADIGATAYAASLGWAGPKHRAIGAARDLGDAFAQIGALASTRNLVDTGATVNSISWAVVLGTVERAHKFLTKR